MHSGQSPRSLDFRGQFVKIADMIKHGQSGDADSDWLKIKTVSFFEVPLFTEKKENRYVKWYLQFRC